jgi:NAD(P)-dependent dehydrogenase (short-subunit alcohol dehydrogenase family)
MNLGNGISLAGKVAMVTGGTNGIGKETSSALAAMGAKVIVVGRNRALAEQTAAQIRNLTGNHEVTFMVADLSSQADIRKLAADFLATQSPLHILLNNAGALFHSRQVSRDGLEMTFALNHMGYFLLTQLLVQKIIESAPARIVCVASRAHKFASAGIRFDDLQMEKNYSGIAVYGQSKLANILFTRELARRLEGTGVTANSLHPGFVASRFGKGNALQSLGMGLLRPFQISIPRGARTPIYLCSSPDVENVSGAYFVNQRAVSPSAAALDDGSARKLWAISESLVNTRGTPA